MSVGLLLLPLCVGAAVTLWRVLLVFGDADSVWAPLVVGAAVWGLVYILFPRPMWAYVAGHELTHALVTLCFGGKVRGIRVRSKGGHVDISKTNFVIALAPYVVPFYVLLVLGALVGARLVWGWTPPEIWLLGILGAAYAFHVTMTAHILRTRQSDITQHGYVFSASIIFLGNVLVLLVGMSLLASNPTLRTTLSWCWESTVDSVRVVQGWIV